jgi:hypothetical protein
MTDNHSTGGASVQGMHLQAANSTLSDLCCWGGLDSSQCECVLHLTHSHLNQKWIARMSRSSLPPKVTRLHASWQQQEQRYQETCLRRHEEAKLRARTDLPIIFWKMSGGNCNKENGKCFETKTKCFEYGDFDQTSHEKDTKHCTKNSFETHSSSFETTMT